MTDRRQFLKLAANTAGAATALASLPGCVHRALQIPPAVRTGTMRDVEHIVILMQENRSFDHYFGTLRGVRGFGDRHPIPLPNGKPVWHQSDGENEVLPFHFDSKATSALRTPGTPHTFDNAQAAWSQGKLDQWPKFKTPLSMGHFRREDIPFQFALAEAFTLCDAYHCSVTTGTDPNRIVFWSGSNFDPELRARGINTTDANAEVNNLRCWLKNTVRPEPVEGHPPSTEYVYQGSAFNWSTIPELLERASITWRIYQDPNDNWAGLMHGCLAFENFRNAKPGDPLFEKGMTGGWLDRFEQDIRELKLPQVSWILPSQQWSEHPSGSSALQGAEFTSRVLDALTANPDIWSKTVLFLTFDENDGLFDHVPPPAPPSYNPDSTLAGASTLDLAGMYFSAVPDSAVSATKKYIDPADTVSGPIRLWGLGPRVPMYVISPWSRGGWVNSQVFDHTSVGQFLEKRFGITVPAISPWHRAICGDLTTCFDFGHPPIESGTSTDLPRITDSAAIVAAAQMRPAPEPCRTPTCQLPTQEPGTRRSRALPYKLHVNARRTPGHPSIELTFTNTGGQGAVFHVYDRLHLDRIPHRYTIEPDKQLTDTWNTADDNGRYDLWVLGPNGFLREFRGKIGDTHALPDIALTYDTRRRAIELTASHSSEAAIELTIRDNAYGLGGPWRFSVAPGRRITHTCSVQASHNWYDFTVATNGCPASPIDACPEFHRRYAGRMETGAHGFSDPAV